jgi:hypothetical protein
MLNAIRRSAALLTVGAALVGTTACDYTGDWLFAGAVDGLEAVQHLGEVEVSTIDVKEDFEAAFLYGEVGPTGTPETGGVTYTFVGTGGDVCIWVDPESTYWIQSLSPIYGSEVFSYPDNTTDDGDLDIEGGLAVFYTGSPGESFGTFQIRYEDSLGNVIPISANECTIPYTDGPSDGHSGRGYPEFCTMRNTQPGVDYLIAMETFATPLDDDRLSYGMFVAHGNCADLQILAETSNAECVVPNEAIDPSTGEPWEGYAEFEQVYCDSAGGTGFGLKDYCEEEADEKDCSVDHCFCGDPATAAPNPEDF